MNLTIAAPVLIEEGILSSSQIGLMGGVFFSYILWGSC